MLTGDKRETAKNIGIACNLIDPDMEVTWSLGEKCDGHLGSYQKLDVITGRKEDLNRLISITGTGSYRCRCLQRTISLH